MADRREHYESAEFLRLVLDSMEDAIKVIDREHRILYANKAAEEFAGASLAEMFCQRCHEQFFGRPEPCDHCLADSTFERGRPLRTVVRLDEGAKTGDFEIMSYPLDDGSPLMIELTRDIGERKRLQEELLRAERLASVGEMTAMVAHEIRNPLGAVIAALDLLRVEPGRPPDDEDMALLSVVRKETKRLNQVVSDFLRYARQPRPQLAPVDLRELAEETVAALKNSEKLRGEVEFDLGGMPPDLPQVLADPSQLRQVLWNVGRNALEAMPDGGRLAFSAGPTDDGVELTVTDTGTGVLVDEVEKIFEPFFTNREDGTGLGLAIARRILEAHGGSIRVQTERGAGTAFALTLPAAALVSGSEE